MKAAVVGASGYIGGELCRLLLSHPRVVLAQATSNALEGQPLHAAHPNLRAQTDMTFSRHDQIVPCDVLFLATPHCVTGLHMPEWENLAPRIIDLTADFRLQSPAEYERYYGVAHPNPELIASFVPGIPEIHRDRLRAATRIAVPGCMANAGILALHPLSDAGLVAGEVVIDGHAGSSGSGGKPNPASHHPDRSGTMRVFKATEHRHEAEISQACGVPVRMTATAVEAVRGVQVVCHVSLSRRLGERDAWAVYRKYYGDEPFVRLVKRRTGLYQLPEPKILSGTNYCDVGFALAADGRHLVAIAALDNLVKGGAGNAVQCLNISCGWDEREGLRFPGLHPI
jgi:N-acetyl-gamma-glutamyl-phosphate/LysW-gamma-L-alpha-aminoadipyl-6-phosphate reductase